MVESSGENLFIILWNWAPHEAECSCHFNIAQRLQSSFIKDVEK